MPVVHVTELPIEKSTQSQLHSLRQYLRKSKVSGFWIKEIADTRGTDTKEASVDVPSLDDAYTLESYINQKPFKHYGVMFCLRAEITEFEEDNDRRLRSRSPAWANQRGGGRKRRRNRAQEYDFARSSYERQSPLYEDSSKLDLELQLLRKKRLLIEEERKLLLEQKKLEYIKDFGASANEFERLGRSRDRQRRPIRDEEAPARNSRPLQPKRKAKGLPLFVMPCNLILKQMTELIDTKTEQEDEKTMLEKVLRTNLRKKFAVALEGKKYLPSNEIVKLYRGKYPESGDEALVTEALESVRLSLWTSDKFPENATDAQGKKQPKKCVKEKNQENSGTSKAESNKVKQDPDEIELKQEKVEDNGTIVSIKEENASEGDLSAIGAHEPDANISAKQEEEASMSENAKEENEITAKKVSAEPEEVTKIVTNGTEEKKANNVDVGAKDSNAMEVDGKVQDKTKDAVVSSAAKTTVKSADIDAVFDQMGHTGDDDWIENGIDWNDDDEGKDEQ